ncbi:MAG TPA: hypothetical protein PLK99_05210 [Burkholderiales bacterium]|nr:hypothetical protein [Burkholderiales bacterium]
MNDLSAEERMLIRGEISVEEPSRGWYPVLVRQERLWWRFFGEKKFSEPFFFDTVFALDQEKSLQTSFDQLEKFGEALEPTAIIFHVSRCGSTLLSQMLASAPECIVMSEPPVIDSILRRHYEGGEQGETEGMLRRAVSALGQKRFLDERHFFLKLDSWHVMSLPLFLRAFPDTPFIFLYRSPGEVIASHGRQRGRQMVPGLVDAAMPLFDFDLPEPGDLEMYCVKMLERFFGAACTHADELMLVNYRQLPGIVWEELSELLGIEFSPERIAAMQSRASLHSKKSEPFCGDPPAGVDCGPTLDADYARLERMRLEQNLFHSTPEIRNHFS